MIKISVVLNKMFGKRRNRDKIEVWDIIIPILFLVELCLVKKSKVEN